MQVPVFEMRSQWPDIENVLERPLLGWFDSPDGPPSMFGQRARGPIACEGLHVACKARFAYNDAFVFTKGLLELVRTVRCIRVGVLVVL